jgi:hypothetical protein
MRILPVLLLFISAGFWACKKHTTRDNPATTTTKLSYGDSVFYLKSTSYTIAPVNSQPGTYSVFPNNLKIDNATGAITVAVKGNDGQSQTGLRYKIKFTSSNNEVDSTYIIISGITYIDRFYFLSKSDSIISPVYNADLRNGLPSGNYNLSSDNKLAISSTNGQINIKETIRKGFFDDLSHPRWKQFTIKYASNDKSNGVENSTDLILYYYNTINDVPSNVSALMQTHQRMLLGIDSPEIPLTSAPTDNNLSSDLSFFKPRPPCVVIVGL